MTRLLNILGLTVLYSGRLRVNGKERKKETLPTVLLTNCPGNSVHMYGASPALKNTVADLIFVKGCSTPVLEGHFVMLIRQFIHLIQVFLPI